MDQKVLELLYRSFDGQLTQAEQERLDEALRHSQALREEKEKIAAMRQAVSGSAAQTFQPFFAERVMQRIQGKRKSMAAVGEDFMSSLAWSFRRIAIAGVIAVLLLLAGSFIQKGEISLNAMLAMPQLTIEDTVVLNNPLEGELK